MKLLILAVFLSLGYCTQGLPVENDVMITERNQTNGKMQILVDMIYERVRANLNLENSLISKNAVQILGEKYRLRKLRNVDYLITKVAIKNGTYYYTRSDYPTRMYYISYASTDSYVESQTIEEDDFFDTIDITYPSPKYLEFGQFTLYTYNNTYTKYRVAHHVLDKVYFIGFLPSAKNGTLYSADIGSTSPGNIVIAEKVNTTYSVVDIAVDQYTGNILYSDNNIDLNLLEKVSYWKDMVDLTDKKSRLLREN